MKKRKLVTCSPLQTCWEGFTGAGELGHFSGLQGCPQEAGLDLFCEVSREGPEDQQVEAKKGAGFQILEGRALYPAEVCEGGPWPLGQGALHGSGERRGLTLSRQAVEDVRLWL